MDGRHRRRTITSRHAAQRVPVEHYGNVVRLRFDLRPDPSCLPTSAWYHAAAVKDEADRRPH